MERVTIGTSGFMLALPDGYSRQSTEERPNCVLARKSPSGNIALFAYEYTIDASLEELLGERVAQLQSATPLEESSTTPLPESALPVDSVLDAPDEQVPLVTTAPQVEPATAEEAPVLDAYSNVEKPAAIHGEIVQRCNETCAYVEYPVLAAPENTLLYYGQYPEYSVRSWTFKKNGQCMQFDIVFTEENRRRTDALLGNLVAVGR